jgi:Zn-dependent metalloprotease
MINKKIKGANMKTIKFIFLLVVMTAITINYCLSSESNNQAKPNNSIKPDTAAIRIQNTKALSIIRFGDKIKLDDNGIPIEIQSNLSKGLTSTDIVEKVFQFFEINKDIFGIENPKNEFIVDAVLEDEIQAVKFHWTVNGVKVASNFRVLFSKDGLPIYYSGKIYPEARLINTKPSISEEQAKQIAMNDSLNTGQESTFMDMELVIGKFKDNKFQLAWTFGISNSRPWIYAIDAHSGEILVRTSAIR